MVRIRQEEELEQYEVDGTDKIVGQVGPRIRDPMHDKGLVSTP